MTLGIVLILNGPANALAIMLVSAQRPPACSGEQAQEQPQQCEECCHCHGIADAEFENSKSSEKDKSDSIRPTCPVCPSCPHFPDGYCVSSPSKAPCAPPLLFVPPDASELAWYLPDPDLSACTSGADDLIEPPRFSQFVPLTI
jgi:hypothetical protein